MMEAAVPLACFLSVIRPPGIQFENALLQIAPVDKGKCPFVRDNNDIVFQLYTRHNPSVAHSLLIGDDESLFASSIDFNDPTVIYFHAFMETPDDGSALMVREAYTHRGDSNVIVVDAQRLEAGPWYFRAAENTWYIGRIAAQFMDYLVTRGLKLSKTHLVGHSLGAQAAGVAGASLQSGLVSRITGLDPALPLFDKLPLAQRLDPSDADFVDVIHTDAGIFGFKQQVGHVDFYPNGGISPQPGCELEVVIPKHLVLNKCNNAAKTIGFLVFRLQEKSNIARNDNVSQHSTEKENRYTKYHATSKSSIADETIKNVFNEPKILKNRPKRTFINHRQHTEQILDKPQRTQNEKRVFRKYTKPDITEKMFSNEKINNNKNKVERSSITIKSHKSKKLFNFIPFFTRTKLTENDKLDNNHENHERSDAIKTTDSITQKTEIPHHRQRRFTSLFTRPQTIESDECIKNHQKRSNTLNTTETITQKRVKISNSRTEIPHYRQRRFIKFFRNTQNNDNNMLLKILDFLVRNRQKIGPTISIIREISTIIKTSNGETLNTIKEQNNIIGDNAGVIKPISSTYNFDFANESRAKTFLRKLLGLGQGNKLIVTTS